MGSGTIMSEVMELLWENERTTIVINLWWIVPSLLVILSVAYTKILLEYLWGMWINYSDARHERRQMKCLEEYQKIYEIESYRKPGGRDRKRNTTRGGN